MDQVQSGFYYLYLSTWIKSHQDFTTCTSVILQPVTGFMAVLLPFLLLHLHHSTTRPWNCSKGQDSSNAGVTRATPPALSLLHPEHVNHPSRQTTRVKHLCPSSLVSATTFTSLIYPSESVLDWGGGEKSLNCKNMCRSLSGPFSTMNHIWIWHTEVCIYLEISDSYMAKVAHLQQLQWGQEHANHTN